MTGPPDDPMEQRLREVLHAEVDSVQPSGDGLERIRERTAQQGFSWLAWLRPAAAVAASIIIIATIVLSTPALREHIVPSQTAGAESTPAETHAGQPPSDDSTEAHGEPVEEPESPQEHQEPDSAGPEDEPEDESAEETHLSATATADCPPGEESGSSHRTSSHEDEDEDAEDDCEPDDEDDPTDDPTDDPSQSPPPTEPGE